MPKQLSMAHRSAGGLRFLYYLASQYPWLLSFWEDGKGETLGANGSPGVLCSPSRGDAA